MEAARAIEEQDEERNRKRKLDLLLGIRDMVFQLDTDKSGEISLTEIEENWDSDVFTELLQQVRLPAGFSPDEFMHLLDSNGNGSLSFDEFLMLFYRLVSSDSFQQSCCVHASLNQLKAMMYQLDEKVNTMYQAKGVVLSLEQKVSAFAKQLARGWRGGTRRRKKRKDKRWSE